MKTAVVILNWNTADFLSTFLPGVISGLEGTDSGVVVADNGSTDASLEVLSRDFPEVRTIRLGQNYGFTGGYNRAVKELLDSDEAPEYIVLLNSDIDVPKGWLEPLVSYMDSHSDCGACGPKLHALIKTDNGYERSSCFEYAGAAGGMLDILGFPFCRGRVLSLTEEDRGQYDTVQDVFWVTGACLLTRASLWKELGGLDDRFFAHMEEIDYCWRAQLLGYRISVIPQSTVWHLGGGTLPKTSPTKLKLNYRNCLLMLDNNLAATIGEKKASAIIFARKLIDRFAALAYLVTGKYKKFLAVRNAHYEYGRMEKRRSSGNGHVTGLADTSIVIQYLLHGNGIFEYLRKRYENNH